MLTLKKMLTLFDEKLTKLTKWKLTKPGVQRLFQAEEITIQNPWGKREWESGEGKENWRGENIGWRDR